MFYKPVSIQIPECSKQTIASVFFTRAANLRSSVARDKMCGSGDDLQSSMEARLAQAAELDAFGNAINAARF